MEQAQQFDWSGRKSLVVRRVDAIAVYVDADGDVIIRQQNPDAAVDIVVTIPAHHAYTVADAIQRQVKAPFAVPIAAVAGS